MHPFGEERADWRCAQTTAAIYNVNIIDKHKKVKVSDFMLKTAEENNDKKDKSQDQLSIEWEEHKEQMRSMGRIRKRNAERLRA